MEQKDLFPKETIITESDDKVVTLTTHRIRYNSSSYGRADIVSIMLEKISSIEAKYTSLIIVLIIGIAIALIGIAMGLSNNSNSHAGKGILINGGIFILVYHGTRKHPVTITSDGGTKITFETKGMKRETILDFINKVEKAKNERILSLAANGI